MNQAAVIGCGPAGLLAAHALALADIQPVIFAVKAEPSPNARGVYLHRSIPEVTSREPDGVVRFRRIGWRAGYAAKVYGDPNARTSWERFNGQFPAWSVEPAYKRLWREYGSEVREQEVTPNVMADIVREFELVVMTAPLWSICYGPGHTFEGRDIWVKDGASVGVGLNEMVYMGDMNVPWYRSSDLFGRRSTEYAHEVEGAVKGEKVLPTTCTCWSDVLRAGRWGEWKPGVLLHHAFERVEQRVRS